MATKKKGASGDFIKLQETYNGDVLHSAKKIELQNLQQKYYQKVENKTRTKTETLKESYKPNLQPR